MLRTLDSRSEFAAVHGARACDGQRLVGLPHQSRKCLAVYTAERFEKAPVQLDSGPDTMILKLQWFESPIPLPHNPRSEVLLCGIAFSLVRYGRVSACC